MLFGGTRAAGCGLSASCVMPLGKQGPVADCCLDGGGVDAITTPKVDLFVHVKDLKRVVHEVFSEFKNSTLASLLFTTTATLEFALDLY